MADVQAKASRAHWQTWNDGVTMTLVDRCMPTFDHKGRMMPGVAAIRTDLVAMSRNQHAKEHARELARFQQHLLPHNVVTRTFSVWKDSPANANAHRDIPDDLDLQKAALVGLINGALDQRWAMITDALIRRVQIVDTMPTDTEAAKAILAAFPGMLPYPIVTATAIGSAPPPNATLHYNWIVIMTMPREAMVLAHSYLCADLVLVPEADGITKIQVCIFDPIRADDANSQRERERQRRERRRRERRRRVRRPPQSISTKTLHEENAALLQILVDVGERLDRLVTAATYP